LFQIKWENRKIGEVGNFCLVSVDGTDFRICEPQPFSTKWFSFKFKAAGLRYEIGISILTGWIVWVNGPFLPGLYPDSKIAKLALVHALDEDELFLADRGYRNNGDHCVTPTGPDDIGEYQRTVVPARHETLNGRLKQWGALNQRY
jgi:hypothetical protein